MFDKVIKKIQILVSITLLVICFQNCAMESNLVRSQGTDLETQPEIDAPLSEDQTLISQFDVPVLEGFPHKADFLYPSKIDSQTRLIVALHGGGGTKHNFAYSLGLKFSPETNYVTESGELDFDQDYLDRNNIALIFIQGQSIPEVPGAFTWTNTIMNSGWDDKAMIRAFVKKIREQQVFKSIYLMGHSMGGVMTNRIWCEEPELFDGYASSAGPMSVNLRSSCQPSLIKPYLHATGLNDRILQIVEDRSIGPDINHVREADLFLDQLTRTFGQTAFVHPRPEFKNEIVSYAWRSQLMCGEVQSAVITVPPLGAKPMMMQSNCQGKLQMYQIIGADHCTNNLTGEDSYKCDIPLTTPGSQDYIQLFVDFFNEQ